MTDKNLRELLDELHDELERTESVDDKEEELLGHLNAHIRALRERSEKKRGEADESILEQLQDAIDHFEVTHPRLTMMLSEMMTVLSNAGI